MKRIDQISRLVLGGGSLFFSAWGLLDPVSLGRAMGTSSVEAKAVGVRELGAGILIATTSGPGPFLLRAVYDASDAVRVRRARPRVAVGALISAALALLQAARRRKAGR